MFIINPAIQIAKSELCFLMGSASTEEDREEAFNRMVKISQVSTLSITTVIDIVCGFVKAGYGSVEDALRSLEKRYRLLEYADKDTAYYADRPTLRSAT